MSTDTDILPMLPIPQASDTPWPTFSLSQEERRAINTGNLQYVKLGITGNQPLNATSTSLKKTFSDPSQVPSISMSTPHIIRSYEPEKADMIIPAPPTLLTILTPDLSLEKPTMAPRPSTSGSPRRLRSHTMK